MKDEISAAVAFVSRFLKRNKNLNHKQVERFADQLSAILLNRFKDHWHTETPEKGQAYRCIRINECEPVDPVLLLAAKQSGLTFRDLDFPSELTLWVDPSEVSCRLGETKSAFCTVASFKDGKVDNRSCSLDIDDLIREHYRKKEDDLNKFKEFTNRHSPTLHANPTDLALQFTPTGEVHMPTMNGHVSHYLPTGQYQQQQHKRHLGGVAGSTRSPVMFAPPPPSLPVVTSAESSSSASSSSVVKSMKTGSNHHSQTNGKLQWASSKSATPTKA